MGEIAVVYIQRFALADVRRTPRGIFIPLPENQKPNRPRPRLTYCSRKMVLTLGATACGLTCGDPFRSFERIRILANQQNERRCLGIRFGATLFPLFQGFVR
jgi:hypothetical protein